MQISTTQLLVGFQSAMNVQQLADTLGVSRREVIDRLKAMTPEEEQIINDAAKGLP